MALTKKVSEILSWYSSENAGTLGNISNLLMSGKLSGTGKLVILPVDQGFEHGPIRSFTDNSEGYDPDYHFQLAIDAGCNAYAAPLGFLESGAVKYAGQIPLILKVNNADSLSTGEPCQTITSSVSDALRLGCVAIGFTIYPGSNLSGKMYNELKNLSLEAKSKGLAVVVWSYPRGGSLAKADETALDVVAYAAHIAAQMGANIIKIKPPDNHIYDPEAKKVIEKSGLKIDTLSDRVKHCVKSTFNGKRIVIFSGGPAKGRDAVLKEIQQVAEGGSFGSIVGRNSFQRPKEEGIKLLNEIMDLYKK